MDDTGDSTSKLANPMIGVKLGGQYTIISIIGEGGMGMIYHARQDLVDREVAIKFLPQALAQDEVNVQRLAREAKALGRLNHANIVTTYDFGFTAKQEPYLVFEYVDGESLQNYLARRGPVPYRECVPIFMQLADAMKYAHTNGVVHRDIKPHNIMIVEKEGKVTAKILDFGIAQMKSETQKLTRAGEIWGSPNYMSPEQCVGDPVDHLTDIYSLGVCMYRSLSGVVPNTGKSFAETVSKKLNQPVPFFGSLELDKPVEIPTGLEEIVIKCLRRYPDERFQSMADLKTALAAFAREEKIIDGTGSVQSPEEIGVQPAKTSSVTRPVGRPVMSQKTDARAESNNKTKALARGDDRAKVEKVGQHPLARLVLPVVALFAALAVLAMGYFLRKEQDDIAVKDNAVKPASAPAPAASTTKPANSAKSANPETPPVKTASPLAPAAPLIEKTGPKEPVQTKAKDLPQVSDQAKEDEPKKATAAQKSAESQTAAEKEKIVAETAEKKKVNAEKAAEAKEKHRLQREKAEPRTWTVEEGAPLGRRRRQRAMADDSLPAPDQEERDFRSMLRRPHKTIFKGGVGAGDDEPPRLHHKDANGFYQDFGGTKD